MHIKELLRHNGQKKPEHIITHFIRSKTNSIYTPTTNNQSQSQCNHYNASYQRLFIGYENGLLEVIDNDGSITISSDIVNFNQSGEKSINHMKEFDDKLYFVIKSSDIVLVD